MLNEVLTAPRSRHDCINDLLPAYLSAYWLRPENAVWMVLRSLALAEADEPGINLDLGCGDGIFSFIHAGGRFDDAFDVFASVGQLDQVTHQHADMFDHVDDRYEPRIKRCPHRSIAVGTDHKQALLAKAESLEFYDRLTVQDHNQRLPFADSQFQSIYCNTLYWVREIDTFLNEIARICRPGGRVIVQVKLDSIRRCTLQGHRAQLGDPLLQILGRGRFDTWTTLADRSTWERRFSRAGLMIDDVQPVASASHAQIWDIGLRPIAPLLVKMANHLDAGTRTAIKQEWVELLLEMTTPLCRPDLNLTRNGAEPVELQYVLTPDR